MVDVVPQSPHLERIINVYHSFDFGVCYDFDSIIHLALMCYAAFDIPTFTPLAQQAATLLDSVENIPKGV